MGEQYDHITPTLQSFIQAQPLFFVATAPLSEHGHVNLSPKGYDTSQNTAPLWKGRDRSARSRAVG